MLKSIKKIDDILFSVNKEINYIRYFEPINFNQEKKKFLKNFHQGKKYNPQFKYKTISERKKNELLKKLDSVNCDFIDDKNLKKIFKYHKKFLKLRLDVVYNIGKDKELLKSVKKYFGNLDKELILEARKNIQNKGLFPGKCSTLLSQVEVKKKVEKFLKDNNYSSWKVKFIEEGAYASVDSSIQTVFLKKLKEYNQDLIEIILYHEILGHVSQNENGKKTKLKIFETGFGHYEVLSEGWALYNEAKKNPDLLNRLYVYYLSTYLATKKDFYDTFVYMLLYLNIDESFMMTTRLKEGLRDTSQKGSFLKDKVYLEGYKIVQKLDKKEFELVKKGIFDYEFFNEVKSILIKKNS